RDGVFEVEEDVVGFTSERFLEHGGLRAGHGELAPLQAGRMRRLVPSETHALTVTRGVVFPPAVCSASGDWAAAPRASSGAAVPQSLSPQARTAARTPSARRRCRAKILSRPSSDMMASDSRNP